MEIVFLSSEVVPFAKTGGLADVGRALPDALSREGVKVRVFMPLYGNVDYKKHGIKKIKKLTQRFSGKAYPYEVFGKKEKGVDFYFIRQKKFFDRPGIYGSVAGDYPDNALRFIFFQKSVMHSLKSLKIKADVIHINDWQTALIPKFLSNGASSVPTVLTVHNLAYQGEYDAKFAKYAGLKKSDLLYEGRFNSLSYGIRNASAVTTVSPTYAREMKTKEFGCGLDYFLKKRGSYFKGILNGLDYGLWNPASDKAISCSYSAASPGGKEKCKKALQKEMGLPQNGAMLVSFVGRLAMQKGMDIMVPALKKLISGKIQFVMLGTGDVYYHRVLSVLAKRFPDNFALRLDFDNDLAHRIYAGSDFFLMPSQYEPCGLGQMIAFAYGTVPIVNSVGGLKDTVSEYLPGERTGTGFLLKNYSSGALEKALRKAMRLYASPGLFKKLSVRCMRQKFSWEKSARGYMRLYRKLIRESGGEL
ncbi:MAG: glycogen/starch synthase [Elusimicrobiota bacterium]|nr:glycogen/starch synthase [Elusimicrobiota bacterium]